MTTMDQIMHNVTVIIYWGENFHGQPKKGIYISTNFTDKNKFKPMIKSIAEVGIIWTLNDIWGCWNIINHM